MGIKSSKTKTKKFAGLNFNLKKIIFSFLSPNDQRKIYWSSKKLRALLPDSALSINIRSFKKQSSYKMNQYGSKILELNDGTIACWTGDFIHILCINNKNNYNSTPRLELLKSFSYRTFCLNSSARPIKQNEHIIFEDGINKLKVCDLDFNLIENLEEYKSICALCNISESLFAVGLSDGTIKIYSQQVENQKCTYKLKKLLSIHNTNVLCLLYIPEHDVLLSSSDTKLVVTNIGIGNGSNCMHESLRILKDHKGCISSIICLNSPNFASASADGEIKFWKFEETNRDNLMCIRTIKAYDEEKFVNLNILANEFMVSFQNFSYEFKIWNVKTYECLKTFSEKSEINRLIVTKNNVIIIGTKQQYKLNPWKIKLWKISE